MVSDPNWIDCLRLKYYCLGIENPLLPPFCDCLGDSFRDLLRSWSPGIVTEEATEGPLRRLTFPALSAPVPLPSPVVEVAKAQKDKEVKKSPDGSDNASKKDDNDDDE